MTETEAFGVIASLFGCWVLGWCTAFLFTYIKQISEKI